MQLSVSQKVGCALQGGHGAMLEEEIKTPGNRDTYNIFIDNGLIYSKWGAQNIFFFHRGGSKK